MFSQQNEYSAHFSPQFLPFLILYHYTLLHQKHPQLLDANLNTGNVCPPVQTSVLLQDRYLVPSSTQEGYCMSVRPDSAQKWQLFKSSVKKMRQISVAIDLKMWAFPCIQQGDCSFFFGTKRTHVHYNDVLYIQTSAACHA